MREEPIWNEDYVLGEMPSPETTEEEVAFLIEALELEPSDRVLDVACGAGRHVKGLAQYGCTVVGVDRSAELLEIARRHVRLPNAFFCRADMRALPFWEAFDVAICLFASFGLLDEAGNQKALGAMAESLKPNGVLLIETWNPYAAVSLDGRRNWWRSGDRFYLAEAEFDPILGVVRDRRTIWDRRSGELREWVRTTRFYTPPELAQMAASVGLFPLRWFGDFDGSELRSDSPRLIVALERRE
ncbi:MAG: type 11 methyltransferase [Candidatus Poribacteria bacterium]|nr:MAG: type 11 methyltransferase [Candidatus Poribacteria bacterium]